MFKIKFKRFYSQLLRLGFLQQGFGIGFPSPTLREILKLGLLDETSYPVFTSLFVVGLALSPILSIPGSKYLGRKLFTIISSLPTIYGLLLISGTGSTAYLLAGRLLHGVGTGMLLALIPHITPAAGRGLLPSLGGVYELVGLLIVYTFGIFLSFRWLAIVGVVLTLLQTFALLSVPQSATWLYSRGLEKRAKCVPEGIRGKEEDALEECYALRTALDTDRENSLSVLYYFKLILAKYRLRSLAVGIILALGFMNTGIDIVYSYTSPLLESSKGIDPNIVAIVVPLFGILGSLFAIFLVETCGRKPLLLTSAMIITGSLLFFACYFLLDELIFGCSTRVLVSYEEYFCSWFTVWLVISLICYSCTLRIGWGSIVYRMMGEVFHIRFVPRILQCIMNVHAISLLTTFPYIASAIGDGCTFFILATANLITCLLILLFLPETKGLKEDEIEQILRK